MGSRPMFVGMPPELTDEQTQALVQLLSRTIEDDRYPVSPHVRVLNDILAKFRPEPERPAPPPPQRYYEPPSKGKYRRRG